MTSSINQLVLDLEQTATTKPDLERLTKCFTATATAEVAAYVYALNQAPALALHFENVSITKTELQKAILTYLGIHNLAHASTSDADAAINEINATKLTFSGLNVIETARRDKILLGYLFSGLVLVKNFHQAEFSLPEKIIIKDYHDSGGFSPSLWGVRFDLDLLEKSIRKLIQLDGHKLTQALKDHQQIDWATLSMLAHL